MSLFMRVNEVKLLVLSAMLSMYFTHRRGLLRGAVSPCSVRNIIQDTVLSRAGLGGLFSEDPQRSPGKMWLGLKRPGWQAGRLGQDGHGPVIGLEAGGTSWPWGASLHSGAPGMPPREG